MVLTERFVFVHLPKTAGTFVTTVLGELYGVRGRGVLRAWRRRRAAMRGYVDVMKHGACSDIPPSHRQLPILATVRNPYDWHVSAYKFGEWRKAEANPDFSRQDWARIRREFPHFPELDFREYLTVFGGNGYRLDTPEPDDHSSYTKRFVKMFFRDFPTSYERIDDATIARGSYVEDMYPVKFLHTESINDELAQALSDFGYAEQAVSLVRGAPKIYPTKGGRPADDAWRRYYTPSMLDEIRHLDRLIFTMFPEYDVARG